MKDVMIQVVYILTLHKADLSIYIKRAHAYI